MCVFTLHSDTGTTPPHKHYFPRIPLKTSCGEGKGAGGGEEETSVVMQQPLMKVEKQRPARGVKASKTTETSTLAAVIVTQTDGGFFWFRLTATLWHEGSRRWFPLRERRSEEILVSPRRGAPSSLRLCRLTSPPVDSNAATASLVCAAANGKRRPVLTCASSSNNNTSHVWPCARER